MKTNSDCALQRLLKRIRQYEKDDAVVIFDLDSTLYSNAGRILSIFSEFAKDVPEYQHFVTGIYPRAVLWSPDEDFRRAGVKEEFLEGYEKFWANRFFSNEFIKWDRPMPGAVRYVNEVYKSGATIIYVTGRDEPRMGKGTRESLRFWGFPFERERVKLILKKDKDQPDVEFKGAQLEMLKKAGNVLGVIDDLPDLTALFSKTFPDAITIQMDVPHPPESPDPLPGLPVISDFLMPGSDRKNYLVVLSGLPATGKSTVANIAAQSLGAPHLATDKIRNELFPEKDIPREIKYSSMAKKKVYSRLYSLTEKYLAQGKSVVMDGTFLRNSRIGLWEIAEKHCASLAFIKTTCTEDVIEKRMARRAVTSDHFSEARSTVYIEMKQRLKSNSDEYLDIVDDPLVSKKGTPLIVLDTGTKTYRGYNVDSHIDLMENICVDFPLYDRILD